jgi:hypothetical protein
MSYVIAAPEMMASAATDLAGISSDLSAAHLAAAPTVSLIPAAADEVSAGVAHLFSSYAQDFHGLVGKAAAFQEQFVQNLTAGAFSYASLEADIARLIADPSLLVPNVAVSVFGHPLVQLGTAHATSGLGGLAVAVGANSDATTGGSVFNYAFALGAGSDATVNAGPAYYLGECEFDTAIAVGTNDVAVAGGSPVPPPYPPGGPVPALSFLPQPGSFDTAFVLGTGSTADATAGNHDLAAVFGNVLTATATGANRLVDIVTPFGTL